MRNLMLACAAFAVISAIVSVNLWRELGAERAQTAQLQAQLAAGPVLQAAPAPVALAADNAAPVDNAPPPAAPAPSAPPPVSYPASAAAALTMLTDRSEMLKDPEYREAAIAQAMLSLPQLYPGLAEELGLAPDVHQKLMRLLAEQNVEQQQSSVRVVAGQEPDQAAMQERVRMAQQLQQKLDENVVSLLGTAKAQEFRDFRSTQSPRMQAAQYGQALQAAGHSLTPEQQRGLTSVMVTEQRRQMDEARANAMAGNANGTVNPLDPAERSRMLAQNMERQKQLNQRVIESARAHLTAAQLTQLEQRMEQQLVMSRASSVMMQRQLELQQGQQGQPVPGNGVFTIVQ